MSTVKRHGTEWIDAARFLAMIGVMIDHTNMALFTNQYIDTFSFFCVSLFVILTGITNYWSYDGRKESAVRILGKKLARIIRPYLIATFVYYIVQYRSFSLAGYIDRVVHFSVNGPFYFVLLYIQMILIAPLLYFWFSWARKRRYDTLLLIAGLAAALVIASFTTRYTNILGVYGGGGKLFGGTNLVLFYLG